MKKITKVVALVATIGMLTSFIGCQPEVTPETPVKTDQNKPDPNPDPDPDPDPEPQIEPESAPDYTVTTIHEETPKNTEALKDVKDIAEGLVEGVVDYKVVSFAGLQKLAEIVNGGNSLAGYTFTQDADLVINENLLDLTTFEVAATDPSTLVNFYGIGLKGKSFAGTYDGAGCLISGLYISYGHQGLGLFGSTNGATIKNVHVTDSTVININNSAGKDGEDDDRFGGIVGLAEGATTIDSCVFIGTIGSEEAKNKGGALEYMGGICGRCDAASVMTGCVAFVKLNATQAALPLNSKGADKVTFTNCLGYNYSNGYVQKDNSMQEEDFNGPDFATAYNDNSEVKAIMDYLELSITAPDPDPDPTPTPTPTPDPE